MNNVNQKVRTMRLMQDFLPPLIEAMEARWMDYATAPSTNLQDMDSRRKVQTMRDMRTLRLDMGARSGRTSVISEMTREGDVILLPNSGLSTHLPQHKTGVVVTRQALLASPGRSQYRKKWRRVWVDEASWWPDGNSYLPEFICNTLLDTMDMTKPEDFPLIVCIG